MSLNAQQVAQEISRVIQELTPEALATLYNELHEEDHIVYLGQGKFEHQDMDD
ncbi:hypothetical protein [Deefgea rivuli]|jgi:hypothetical protein|uniref:hypothetical protein n=1 Tax=Deefgea rivuli TaxID=400948 RepID=UPI0012EC1AE3|nr:hypothetical protein [Deefgea rivuli]